MASEIRETSEIVRKANKVKAVYTQEVDSGGDEYATVVSPKKIDIRTAQKILSKSFNMSNKAREQNEEKYGGSLIEWP